MLAERRRILVALVGAALAPLARAQHNHGKASSPPPGPESIKSTETPFPPRNTPFAADEPFARLLRVPSDRGLMGNLSLADAVTLEARPTRLDLLQGRHTDLLTFEAGGEGKRLFNPTLLARRGDRIDATLANQLGEDSTIHWHGMHVDEENDGSGMKPVAHGSRKRYRFEVLTRGGLYWYHPHPHHRTGFQVHQGLGGLLLVRDDEDEALNDALGLEYGVTELPLLLHDKQIDERNRLKYSMGEDDWIGNRMMVNWTPTPRHEVRTGIYRLRILNGSNARVYRLAFEAAGRRLPFWLVGTDGGLIPSAQRVPEVYFAPAQRLDILLDLRSLPVGARVVMRSLKYEPMENDPREGLLDPAIEHPGAPMMGEAVDLMCFDVVARGEKGARALPARICRPLATPRAGKQQRHFRIHANKTKWLLNGRNYHDDMHGVSFVVKGRAAETWSIKNEFRSMPHPMHLHGFHFKVLARTNSPPQVRRLAVTSGARSPQDLGWLDTVLVWPGETVSLLVDFSPAFAGRNHYMFHCHNLEHEDQGLMLNFAVE